MARNLVCGDCGGAMEDGFILDFTKYSRVQSAWVKGSPDKDWVGVSLDKPNYFINAYRCSKCGLLKLYAGPDKSDQEK